MLTVFIRLAQVCNEIAYAAVYPICACELVELLTVGPIQYEEHPSTQDNCCSWATIATIVSAIAYVETLECLVNVREQPTLGI